MQMRPAKPFTLTVLTLVLLTVIACFSSATAANLVEGDWVYEISTTTDDNPFEPAPATTSATVLWATDNVKTYQVVMVPVSLGDTPVGTLGNGAQNVLSNNKTGNNFVLIPDGVSAISTRAVYDYNNTAGWSIPGSVETIADNAFVSSSGGIFYGEEDSAASDFAEESFISYTADGSTTFSAAAGENGYIQPNGTYYLPSAMLDGSYSVSISIVADVGYKITALSIDGANDATAAGQNEYAFDYTFSGDSYEISVTFEEDPDDTREDPDNEYDYTAPDIVEGAVSAAAQLPDDVNDYAGVNTGTTAKYTNTMGISTGLYYAAEGKLYEMIYSSQNQETPEYYSKAEVINGVYENDGLVFGEDYDHIRLYNYYENVTEGPSTGEKMLYCAYLYKTFQGTLDGGEIVLDDAYVNTAVIFAQKGADLTVSNLTESCYTGSVGPSEAGNFFGLGSSIHVDGGDNATAATKYVNTDTSTLTLINPQILGTVNSMYSLANGVLNIQGGNVFSCTSGGHGPYVSTAGQIFLNTDGTGILVSDDDTGKMMANTDVDSLTATLRPSSDLGTMQRIDGVIQGVYQEHDDDVSVIVTGDEAGTALATDTGGGLIVANQVNTKTYGLRCAGVYSIGANESWVNCYNSTLTSYLDAGLCSASGGYIYAHNCDITGVMGLKTRAGGDETATETGITVINSRVSAYYDYDEMVSAYDVADPADWDDSMADQTTSSSQLNIFLDKANTPRFYEESLTWWFKDKSKTPGYSGGNKFAVIYVENSVTPITIDSSYLVNRNYLEYGDPSTLDADETPADNLLVSVESAGTGNITFINENRRTTWDLTGTSTETCELVGDFYLGEESTAGDNPNLGTGPNTLNADFVNSFWKGSVIRADDTGVANLTLDADSIWVVTADTTVNDLTLASQRNLRAWARRNIIILGTLTIEGSAITQNTRIGNITYVIGKESVTDASTPVIISQPEDAAVTAGVPAWFRVRATADGWLSYQWYRHTEDSSTGGTLIDGATRRWLKVTEDETGTSYYYCVVTNTNKNASGEKTASATSRVARLVAN